MARGGDVLAPGRPERPVQYIDVRDLAEWCVRVAEERRTGTFTAVGPASTLTMGRFLDECRDAIGSGRPITAEREAEVLARVR